MSGAELAHWQRFALTIGLFVAAAVGSLLAVAVLDAPFARWAHRHPTANLMIGGVWLALVATYLLPLLWQATAAP